MLAYAYGAADKQKQLWEFHLVMFHMQSIVHICLSWQVVWLYSLFLFPLSKFA